jgi:hypothetical protein
VRWDPRDRLGLPDLRVTPDRLDLLDRPDPRDRKDYRDYRDYRGSAVT